MSRYFPGIAMELALLTVGHRFPRLSEVGAAWGEDTGGPTKVDLEPPMERSFRVDTETGGYGIFLLDITITDERRIHLIEANGSNAALSSSVRAKDDRRAAHMFLSYKSKRKPAGRVAAVLGHQKGLLHVAEFFGRAGIFAELVSETQSTRLCNVDENLGDEEVSVVCDSLVRLAERITRKGDQLYFKDRPIAFGTNSNLLAELARRGIVGFSSGKYDFDVSFYHEGPATELVHDKGAQQLVAEGSGITPLKYREASSEEECITVVREFHEEGMVAVGKMNAGSGGAGIEFFPPQISWSENEERLRRLIESAKVKYGAEVERTLFPIRFFEFAKSTRYDLYGRGHLWDMRMQCLIYPGYVDVTPCVIRLCPEAFDEKTFAWDSVVSNLTGREPNGRYMRSPAAMRRSKPGSVLEAVGIDSTMLREIEMSCGRWCEAAWKWSIADRESRGLRAA